MSARAFDAASYGDGWSNDAAGDLPGRVRGTLSDTGAALGTVNYDPWGSPRSGSVPAFGFTGDLHDCATGLVNLRAKM